MGRLFFYCGFWLAISAASPAYGQNGAESVPKPPKWLLMPWSPVHLGGEEVAALRLNVEKELAASRQALGAMETLTQLAEQAQRPVSRTLSTRAGATYASQETADEGIALLPISCGVGDRLVHMITAVTTGGMWLAADHRSVLRAAVNAADFAQLVKQVRDRAATAAIDRATALQVGLRLRRETTRQDEASSHCLNMILASKLVEQGFKVTLPVGRENFRMIKQVLGYSSKWVRPTYVVKTTYLMAKSPNLPDVKLGYRLSASIFADTLVSGPPVPVNLAVDQERLEFDIPPALLDFLTKKRLQQGFDRQPKVVKIWGAWAYLNLGRGWGLRMADRLAAADSAIKGHVVGYYGPELELADETGEVITDGAIVFIRKGQRLVTNDTTFAYDQTVYPTPWPP